MNKQLAVAAVLGPVDRVHFLDEQRRNRRASWRFSLFAAVSAALSGLPLSILLSPLRFGLMLLFIHGIKLVSPVPTGMWNALEQIARAVPDTWALINGEDRSVPWALLAVTLVVDAETVDGVHRMEHPRRVPGNCVRGVQPADNVPAAVGSLVDVAIRLRELR